MDHGNRSSCQKLYYFVTILPNILFVLHLLEFQVAFQHSLDCTQFTTDFNRVQVAVFS